MIWSFGIYKRIGVYKSVPVLPVSATILPRIKKNKWFTGKREQLNEKGGGYLCANPFYDLCLRSLKTHRRRFRPRRL